DSVSPVIVNDSGHSSEAESDDGRDREGNSQGVEVQPKVEPLEMARRVNGRIKCNLTEHVYRAKAKVIPSPARERNLSINTVPELDRLTKMSDEQEKRPIRLDRPLISVIGDFAIHACNEAYEIVWFNST
nr:poly(A) polymerase [Tanacetum cinerariifolium]